MVELTPAGRCRRRSTSSGTAASGEMFISHGWNIPRKGRNRGSSGWSIIRARAATVKSPAPEGRRSRVESDKLRCLAFQPRLELRLGAQHDVRSNHLHAHSRRH